MEHASDHALVLEKFGNQPAIIVRPPMARLSRDRPEQSRSTAKPTPQLRRPSYSRWNVGRSMFEAPTNTAAERPFENHKMRAERGTPGTNPKSLRPAEVTFLPDDLDLLRDAVDRQRGYVARDPAMDGRGSALRGGPRRA